MFEYLLLWQGDLFIHSRRYNPEFDFSRDRQIVGTIAKQWLVTLLYDNGDTQGTREAKPKLWKRALWAFANPGRGEDFDGDCCVDIELCCVLMVVLILSEVSF